MLAIEGVRDHKSLRAWLESLPQSDATQQQVVWRISVDLSFRSAARVLPLWWHFCLTDDRASQRGISALGVLRSLVATSLAEFASDNEMRLGLAAAADRVSWEASLADASRLEAKAAAVAARMAVVAARTATASEATTAFLAASSGIATAGFFGSDFMWRGIREDLQAFLEGREVSDQLLWSAENPTLFKWQNITESRLPEGWNFFVEWYERLLKGTTLPWERSMTLEVASLPDSIWQNEVVALQRINEIWLRYMSEATPNSEELCQDETGRFYFLPVTTIRPELFRDACEKLRDTLAELRANWSDNQYSALQADVARLEDFLDRYRDNPQRLHDVFEKTIRHIDRKIAAGECPGSDELIGDLREDLDSGAIDIRRSDTEVAKTVKARSAVRLRRLDSEKKASLRRVTAQVAEDHARKDTGEELKAAAATVSDEVAPTEDVEEAQYELVSRMSRMARAGKDGVVKAGDDVAKVGKGVEAADGLWDTITALIGGMFG